MEVQKIVAHEKLADDKGKVALQRGPLIYCAEGWDNGGRAANIILPQATTFTTEYQPTLLNGIMVLKSSVPALVVDTKNNKVTTEQKPFTAIPYYAWANRGKSEMMVWFPEQITDIDILTK